MRGLGAAISILAGLLLGSAVAADEPPMAEPRMVGDMTAGPLDVLEAVTVRDDLVFLGTRGRERISLRWLEHAGDRERRLATARYDDQARTLAPTGDGIIFTGHRGRQGTEPWHSDGTRAGTRLIKEINRGRQSANCAPPGADCPTYPAGSNPSFFLEVDGVTYFAANHPRSGKELWRTDGTRAGTRLVRDIRPGRKSGMSWSEASLAQFEGELYFVANDGRHGHELWRSDGTRKGTRLVRDIGPGWSSVWWARPVAAGEHLYFVAEREAEGAELWRTDGTRKGTRLVRDIRQGPKSSKPKDLTAVGDGLYFTAADGDHGRELWRTDGTAQGTVLVKDLTPGRQSSSLSDFVAVGDSLYVTERDLSDELTTPGDLWRTVDDEPGLEPVSLPGGVATEATRYWSDLPTLASHGDRLFLTFADSAHGNELWVIDGPTSDPALVADIRPGPQGSDPHWLTVADSVLYFTADDGEHGRQLWAMPLGT